MNKKENGELDRREGLSSETKIRLGGLLASLAFPLLNLYQILHYFFANTF